MKLAIIEDRISRMEQFQKFDIRSSQVIQTITENNFVNLATDLSNSISTRLEGFDCIMAHRSAFTNVQRDVIKLHCKYNMTPLVFFSGGISSSIYNDSQFPYLNINAKDFYSKNIELFIQDYEKTGNPNLLVLQFGLRWSLNLLLALRDNLNLVASINKTIRLRHLRIVQPLKERLNFENAMPWVNMQEHYVLTPENIVSLHRRLNILINEAI